MVTPVDQAPARAHSGFVLTPLQAVLVTLFLSLGALVVTTTIPDRSLLAALFLFAVTLAGLWACRRTRLLLGDPKLGILGTLWLLKLFTTIALLYWGWIPLLDPDATTSVEWGYDPQRFYQDAWDLIQNGWNPLVETNYQGIIFYYGGLFWVFGHNALVPALLNAFVTLMGTLFLIRCLYDLCPERLPRDWLAALLLVIPEILWYDVMTSRETLMATLLVFAILGPGRNIIGAGKTSLSRTLVVAAVAVFGIAAVRTSMAICVVVGLGAMAFFLRSRRKSGWLMKLFMLALGGGLLVAGPMVQSLVGGSEVDYVRILNQQASEAASEVEWSENSIGRLLTPKGPLQTVAFLPPRMILYLASPLPVLQVTFSRLMEGDWRAWQNMMTVSTSVLMLLGFPYMLAGLVRAWKTRRQEPGPMVLQIAFWVVFMVVAGGNIIIHERYRVMCTGLFFACLWFGSTRCEPDEVARWMRRWFGFLMLIVILYMGYKLAG